MSKKFALNFQDLFEINVTPEATSATYARLAVGIKSVSPDNNEELAQEKYLDGDGWGSTDVIGAQKILTVSGNRVVGDTVQDFVAGLEFSLGDDRKTTARYTDAEGNQTVMDVTLAKIKIGGGDAAAKKELSFEVHANGKPTYTEKTAAAALSATIAAGSATGTTKATITKTSETDTLAYKLQASAADTVYGSQYVDVGSLIAYTSAADIAVTSGQHLCLYELNSYGRVVAFVDHTVASGDIKAA